jgi:hypothetical protein
MDTPRSLRDRIIVTIDYDGLVRLSVVQNEQYGQIPEVGLLDVAQLPD